MSEAKPTRGEIDALISLVDQERYTDAEFQTRIMLAQHPKTGMLWKVLGVALLRQGKGALQALRKTAELLPLDAEAHGNLGLALMDLRQWTEALACWRRALDIEPRNVEALVGAADALRALGRAADSLAFYQGALRVKPGLLEAGNNLGNAYLELRRFAEAIECYQRVADVEPDDAQVHSNLSNALRQWGALDDALVSARRSVALDPDLSVAHANLGHVLRDLGQSRAAASSYSRALELDPERAENHSNLGNALFDMGRAGNAAECHGHAIALLPAYAAAHLSLSAALRLLRLPDEAEASCRAALALEPESVEALSFLGELEADRGRFFQAHAMFQRAIDLDAAYPFAYCSIAMHRKMTEADGQWLRGVTALLGERQPLRHEISVRHALGKYFDDVGRYAEAFDQYRQANELTKRQDASYDGAKLHRRIDAIMRYVRPVPLQGIEPYGCTSQLPVFVVGMPRSGTSLVEQILASHPAVIGAGELKYWDAAFDELADGDRSNIAKDYLSLLPTVPDGVLRVIDKMPANFLYAGLIHAVFPDARIIHMQRHPLDTCLSVYFQNFFGMGPHANDLDDLAHYYGEYLRVTAHWRNVLPASTLLEVPYEALVADQEGWTRRILSFIGLPWDARCLDFHETDRLVLTASKWQVRQKMHASAVGRWKNYEPWLGSLIETLGGAARAVD